MLSRVARLVLAETNVREILLGPEYFYKSLPLALIDAVFSIGVTYVSTRNTVERFCQRQLPRWHRAREHGSPEYTISDFLEIVGRLPAERLAVEVYGNRQRTSVRNGILKAEAVTRCAVVLEKHGVVRFADSNLLHDNHQLEGDFRSIPGQRSGKSFNYLKMLCGDEEGIKLDRHIVNFMTRFGITSIGDLKAIAKELDVSPRKLDHAIWQKMSQSSA
jgi:hypothetical protein